MKSQCIKLIMSFLLAVTLLSSSLVEASTDDLQLDKVVVQTIKKLVFVTHEDNKLKVGRFGYCTSLPFLCTPSRR